MTAARPLLRVAHSERPFMKSEKTASPIPWVLLLDAGVIVTNFFLVGFLSSEMGAIVRRAWVEEDAQAGRLLGFALLATFVAQMIGAVLKPAPMHARLRARRVRAGRDDEPKKKSGKRARPRAGDATSLYKAVSSYMAFFYVLLFLHFVLSSLIVFTIPVLLGEEKYDWMYCLSIPFMFIPTILVGAALMPPKPDEPAPTGWRAHPLMETVANFGLFSYALINQLFWASWLAPNTPLTSAAEIPARLLESLLFLVPVTLMYFFSPRILFLAEELDDPRTRVSMTLAVLSIVFRWVVGADTGKGNWVG